MAPKSAGQTVEQQSRKLNRGAAGPRADLYSLVIVVAVILSWVRVDRRNPVATIVRGLTEPVLTPIRNVLRPMGGLDFSPMVLLIVLQLLKGFLF